MSKFADAEHVSEYMRVHTFLTGIRGVLAPVIAFSLIGGVGPGVVQWIAIASALLVFLSSAMLLPELRAERKV